MIVVYQPVKVGPAIRLQGHILVGKQIHRRRVTRGEQGGRDRRLEAPLGIGVVDGLDRQRPMIEIGDHPALVALRVLDVHGTVGDLGVILAPAFLNVGFQ